MTELELGYSLEALAPATRSLENVLRQAVSSGPGLRLISAVSVDGGPLPSPYSTHGYVSINGGPAILVPQLQQSIPRDGQGPPPHTYPGVTVYLLAFEGGLLAIGYVDTLGA